MIVRIMDSCHDGHPEGNGRHHEKQRLIKTPPSDNYHLGILAQVFSLQLVAAQAVYWQKL